MKFIVFVVLLFVDSVNSHGSDVRGNCLYGNIVDEIRIPRPGVGGSGEITSIGYPHAYEGNADCEHVMYRTFNTMATTVVIEVVDLRTEPGNDELTISEGYYFLYDMNADTSTVTLTSKLDDSRLCLSKTNTKYDTYKWVSSFAGNVTIRFESDTEINGPGYKIKYAFDNCVDMSDPDHGKWKKVTVSGKTKYKLICEDGFEVVAKDIFKFVERDEYTENNYAYCTGATEDDEEESYLWKNSEYRCARKVGDCVAPIISDGILEQSVDNDKEYHVKCDVPTNAIRGLGSLHCVHSGGSWRWREWDTDNQNTFEYPSCVASLCESLDNSPDDITVINSAKEYKPGSYIRERCNEVYKVEDMTRWCLPTGKWTEGQHCEIVEDAELEDDQDDLDEE